MRKDAKILLAVIGGFVLLAVVICAATLSSVGDTTDVASTPVNTTSTPASTNTATTTPSEPAKTTQAPSTPHTPASECPVCYQTGEYQPGSGTYGCYDCGLVWMPDEENHVKWTASILDYVDDEQIDSSEIYAVPWS